MIFRFIPDWRVSLMLDAAVRGLRWRK